jgi:hypothetical protein
MMAMMIKRQNYSENDLKFPGEKHGALSSSGKKRLKKKVRNRLKAHCREETTELCCK